MPKKNEKVTQLFEEPCSLADSCAHAGEDCTDKGKHERESACYEEGENMGESSNAGGEPGLVDGETASNEVEIQEEDGSESIPETSETATADENGVTLAGKEEGFIKGILVDVTPIQMGEYALEQATLYRELKETEEAKKSTAKSYSDRITRMEVRLDEISKIITEGVIEKPISCQWQFDFEHGVKRLVRLDNHTVVDEKVLTQEEYQLDLNYVAEQSIQNVNEAFQETATDEASTTETDEQAEAQEEVATGEETPVTEEMPEEAA